MDSVRIGYYHPRAMIRKGRGFLVSVFLPAHLAGGLEAFAAREFGGNVSAAVQWALQQAGVTKSPDELSREATVPGLP